MSIFEPKLFDSFDIKGEWWLPGTPGIKKSGTLSYESGQSITLETLGSLRGPDAVWNDIREYPEIILGRSNDGKEVTLYRNAEIHKSSSSRGGSGTTRYQCFDIFVGAHFDAIDGLLFDSSTVNFSFLEEWAAKRPFRTKMGDDFSQTATYDLHISSEFLIPAIDSTFRLWHGLSSGRHDDFYRKMVWEHSAHIDLEPNGGRDFEWFRSHLFKLRNFLTLCVGRSVHMQQVALSIATQGPVEDGHPKSPEKIIYLFFTQKQGLNEPELHPGDLVLSLNDIDENQLMSILDNWFRTADSLETVHQLYFGSIVRKAMYDHLRFLSLTQALETYHRVARHGLYLPESEYDKIIAVLLPSIPGDAPQALRESLKSRIKYGNEHSLRKRIRSLIDGLSENCSMLVTDNAADFVARIIDTRNYLTHYSDELKDGVFSGSDLYNSTKRLKILILILLFKEIGLDEEKIAALIKKNSELMFGWVSDIKFENENVKKQLTS